MFSDRQENKYNKYDFNIYYISTRFFFIKTNKEMEVQE